MANKSQRQGPSAVVQQGSRKLGGVGGRAAVLHYSRKAEGTIALESVAERALVQIADIDPRVRGIKAQPFTVDVVTGALYYTKEELKQARQGRQRAEARIRDYTPDLSLDIVTGHTVIVEAKDERFLEAEEADEYWKKIERARSILLQRGYDFQLVPTNAKLNHPLFANAAILSAFANQSSNTPYSEQLEAVERLFQEVPAPTLRDVLKVTSTSLREAPMWFLSGVISADLKSVAIGINTLVTAAFGDLGHLQLFPLGE